MNADDANTGTPKAPRLLDQVRDAIARLHYSPRTEEAYVHWIKRFIYFSGRRHPATLGAAEVTAFLNHLARGRDVAAATQNQALSALLFLYREVLGTALPWLDDLDRVQRPARLPTVLSPGEAQRLLAAMSGTKWLMASLLYGAGLRLRECLRLRVKDVDFAYAQVVVRDGKGQRIASRCCRSRWWSRCRRTCGKCGSCTSSTLRAGTATWSCRMRSRLEAPAPAYAA